MALVDWLIVLVIALAVLGGFQQGFFRSVSSLGGLLLGLVLAAWNYGRVAALFMPLVRIDAIADAIGSFKSVKRRLEVRAVIGGVTVIEDFAHHPTAIRETLKTLRAVYPSGRIWAVLEPRSNTLRRKVLESDLIASLRLADRVVLAGVYQQQRIPDAERLHPEDVVDTLNGEGIGAVLLPDAEAIVEAIAPQVEPGDVVAILSNGGFDGIYEKLPARLNRRFSSIGQFTIPEPKTQA